MTTIFSYSETYIEVWGGITVVYSVVSGEDVYVGGSILTTMMFDGELCVDVFEYCEYMSGVCVDSPIECVDRLQT